MEETARDTLARWTRRASDWAELRFHALAGDAPRQGATTLLRLRRWPLLPQPLRTAPVYRVLSVMSQRPVNRAWLRTQLQLQPALVEPLLQLLREQEALEETEQSYTKA